MSEAIAFSARALSSDAEAADWGALCARGFAHRGGAVDRFFVRYMRDPAKKQDWVRVTVTPEGRFVGSVRVFDRRLDIDGIFHPACGLGEGEHNYESDYQFSGWHLSLQSVQCVSTPSTVVKASAMCRCPMQLVWVVGCRRGRASTRHPNPINGRLCRS